eukprot:14140078-Ditylum_brightwellii.AAC.1
MILNDQLTTKQEAIFQEQQPNKCYYHQNDGHPSCPTATSPGCSVLNGFKQRYCQAQNQGGRGGHGGVCSGACGDGGRGWGAARAGGRGGGHYQRPPPQPQLQEQEQQQNKDNEQQAQHVNIGDLEN